MTQAIKLAVVTDDGETISAHFGRAQFYVIYTVEDGAVTQRDQVAKPVHQHGQHGHVHLHPEGDHADEADRHADMFAPIRDCTAVLTRGMGYGAHTGLTGIGVQPIITDVRLIADGAAAYVAGTLVDHPERLH